MGIFDDAIREHLELKRHAGADEEELQELEDEAFGPPARPGEPDFPGSSGEAEAEPDAGGESAPFDASADEASGAEGEAAPRNEAVGAIQEAPEIKPEAPEIEPEAEAPEPPALEPEPEALEAPSESFGKPFDLDTETSGLDAPDGGSSFTTEEREAIADQPTVFFEQQEPAELELGDLDLDLDEEIEEVGDTIAEPLTDEEPLAFEEAPADEPVEAVEPVDEVVEAEPPHEAEPEPDPLVEPESALELEEPEVDVSESTPGHEGEELGIDEEDVLEETPEFLRDNPDDDELWFEQGAPKDFDF